MHHVLRLAAAAMLTASAARADTYPITQDRDEPGRNAYQENKFGCDTTDCTLQFATVAAGRRRIITNIACDQFIPSGGNPYYVTLASSTFGSVFIPILFSYAGPYNTNAGYIYIANLTTFAKFNSGERPVITMIGGNPVIVNAHCNLSGYDDKS